MHRVKRQTKNRAVNASTLLADAYAHLSAGRYEAALQLFCQVLETAPNEPAALHGLGLACFQLTRLDDALALLRRAVELTPENAEYHNNLGTLLAAKRQFEEATLCHHRAVQLAPALPEAHNNLANALRQLGRLPLALMSVDSALALRPAYAEAHLNRGNILRDMRRLKEAEAAYHAALEHNPQLADAYNNLGTVYTLENRWTEALAAYGAALDRAPHSASAHYNLGTAHYQLGQLESASAALTRALELQPHLAEAELNLGNIAKDQGRLAIAIEHFQAALNLRPHYAAARSNLLFTLNYVDGVSQAEIYTHHLAFAQLHAAAHRAAWRPFPNPRDPTRRLRIAYVSPDLRGHACACFVEPLLRLHDRAQFEVYAYAEVAKPDEVTMRLKGLCDQWRDTVGQTDDEVAARIRHDAIDIVIDLAGHTANNRLLALARKPAPVQVSYLGYPATTGVPAMDYRLTDAVTEPAGLAEQYYTEKLERLPQSLWCYRPLDDMPPVSPSPALANGYVTFGSVNNFAKVGSRVIALWARVLHRVPDARLAMLCANDRATLCAVYDEFAARGIARERLSLYGREPRDGYLRRFAAIDIALDPFPCNGGTTTCDALWMGVPVVTLRGSTFLSRASLSVLTAAGCADWAGDDEEAYIAICAQLAADPAALAAIRATLRARLSHSPLLDGVAFTRDVEATLRRLWSRWCMEEAA